jgi:hypothetical protein
MTWPELIERNLKWFLIVLTLLLTLVILIMLNDYNVSFSPFKLYKQPNEVVVHDTIIRSIALPAETVKVEVPKTIQSSPQKGKTKITTPKEVIETQQPSNINTGTNNGIIGNNNQVSLRRKPNLDEAFFKNLLRHIKGGFQRYNLETNHCIEIIQEWDDPHSSDVANKIQKFLKDQGFNVLDTIAPFIDKSKYETRILVGFQGECLEVAINHTDNL